jgi:nitronate monooxygenase/enoyl-[acyl-carrier protein] reductase II
MHQVTTVTEAVAAARAGVDIIVAQGGESGGYSGSISTMVLVPQVVDAVRPLPVVAAGGIFDGRGFAAALMLGAVGINVGTRFLAANEAPIPQAYKEMIAGATSEDTMQFRAFNRLLPDLVAGGYDVALRTLKTDFTDEWEPRLGEVEAQRDNLLEQFGRAAASGQLQAIVAPAGQTSGGIGRILSAAEIVTQLVTEAEAVLRTARDISPT